MKTVEIPEQLQLYWAELACGFPRVAEVFPDCMRVALSSLSAGGVAAYIEHAKFLGKMGRGAEPILIFLEVWPEVAGEVGEDTLPDIMEFIRRIISRPTVRRSPRSRSRCRLLCGVCIHASS